ncbi:MAG TPA: HPF/RaiA family ribosome-associated protein [Ktedonobacterales bacterium]|nr:HPF/RaiA family ribosome-associated protein [Ktedonobacterales bacterium]
MQTAPEVIFNGVDRSAWVENYVAERLEHLEKFARDITSCHVTLSREQSSQRKGNRYSVMVEVRVPRQHDLAVRKQKQIHDMQTQLPAIINEAFGAIETQLKRTIARRRHEEKAHNGQPHGMVEKIFPEEGYGFIRAPEIDRQVYFHRNSVLHDDFERLTVGTEVRFAAEEGDDGPQASSVQVVSKPGARWREKTPNG